MAINWQRLKAYTTSSGYSAYIGTGKAPAQYRINKETRHHGEMLYFASINTADLGSYRKLTAAKRACELHDEKYRAKNPLPMPDIVLRFNDLIATIGSIPTTGKRFLLLKKRGERKPILDSVMPIDMIRDKLAKIGFDVSGLRAENPLDIEPFTPAQMAKLKEKWANAGMPSVVSPAYIKTEKYLENLPDENLRQIKAAKIRVLGVMANMILRDKRGINPVPEGRTSKIKKATALYEDFRDQPGAEILDLPMPEFSTGMVIGRLSAVEYDTVRAGKREDYRHTFKKSAAPLLCVTACGKYLFTVQGGFTFTERGIVDN